MTKEPTPLSGLTARDIATHYTYSASRVQLNVVDESTVLAVGFADAAPHRATGRVAWIRRSPGAPWIFDARCLDGEGVVDNPHEHASSSEWTLDTTDDLGRYSPTE